MARGWWRPGGLLLEAAAGLTRRQVRGGPWVPRPRCPVVVFAGPRLGPPGHGRTRHPRSREGRVLPSPLRGAAPAGPPAPRQDQWERLNLKVPPYSPPTPHVHCCHGNAHPETALVPTVHTHTLERELYRQSPGTVRARGGLHPAWRGPGARWVCGNRWGRLEAAPRLLREARAAKPCRVSCGGAGPPPRATFPPLLK